MLPVRPQSPCQELAGSSRKSKGEHRQDVPHVSAGSRLWQATAWLGEGAGHAVQALWTRPLASLALIVSWQARLAQTPLQTHDGQAWVPELTLSLPTLTDGLYEAGIRSVVFAASTFTDVYATDDCHAMADLLHGAAGGPDAQSARHLVELAAARRPDHGYLDIDCETREGSHRLGKALVKLRNTFNQTLYNPNDHQDPAWHRVLSPTGERALVHVASPLQAFSSEVAIRESKVQFQLPWWPVPNQTTSSSTHRTPIHRAFDLAQSAAPTILVVSNQLWERSVLTTPMLESAFNRTTVFDHYRAQGYYIAQVGLSGETHAAATLFIPPIPQASQLLGALLPGYAQDITLLAPTTEGVKHFMSQYPHHLREPAVPDDSVAPVDGTPADELQESSGGTGAALAAVAGVVGVVLAGGWRVSALRNKPDRRTTRGSMPATDATPDTDSKGAATSHRPRSREHSGLSGPETMEQDEIIEPLPRDSKEALHTADARLKGQTWKVQQEEWPRLARHIGKALVEGLPTIAVAILWSAYNHSQRELQELFADKAVNGPALRSIRRSLELSHELHTEPGILLDIQTAVKHLDIIMLTLSSADKESAKDEKGITRQDTKDGKQGADEVPPGDAEAPRRSAWPFMPPSQTVARKSAYDIYHHFKREAGRGQLTAELRENRKEMAVPAFGTYPHLHFGQFGMVYSEKPEGGRPVIFGKGDEFNPAVYDRVYASLPDDERGAEIRRVLDNIADNGGAR